MNIELHKITVRELTAGYEDNNENGVRAFGGNLDVRPPYQREFVYGEKERDAVIDTLTNGFPLNVMYWAVREDGTFEIIDGQQRTISICQYVNGDFAFNFRYFHNLQPDEQEQILDYPLQVYICSGSYFSKNNCAAYGLASKYVSGEVNRQAYLEIAIRWISNGNIEVYMGNHQHDPNAVALWNHFSSVINWVKATFPNYRREMKGVDWGTLYAKYHEGIWDASVLETEVKRLMADSDVQKKKGIYTYVFDHDEHHLDIRAFDDNMKREVYERQDGICSVCGKHFEIEQMEADHITPWRDGGRTVAENCQMLCRECNRRKSGK